MLIPIQDDSAHARAAREQDPSDGSDTATVQSGDVLTPDESTTASQWDGSRSTSDDGNDRTDLLSAAEVRLHRSSPPPEYDEAVLETPASSATGARVGLPGPTDKGNKKDHDEHDNLPYRDSSSHPDPQPPNYDSLTAVDAEINGRLGYGAVMPGSCPPRISKPEVLTFTYDVTDQFTFEQFSDSSTQDWFKFDGDISVIFGSNVQSDSVAVDLTVQSHGNDPFELLKLDEHKTGMRLSPASLKRKTRTRDTNECISISAIITLPKRSKLKLLQIHSDKFNVKIVGSHALPSLRISSPRTEVHQAHGGITGTFHLRDSLSLSTASGNIDVDVIAHSTEDSSSDAAHFSAHSASGSIKVDFPVPAGGIPRRDYDIDVHSASGRIDGSYLLGSRTSLRANSAAISASFLPVDGDKPGYLATVSNSGSVDASVAAPAYGNALKLLSGAHKSNSGRISVAYPSSWEGKIAAKSNSGRVSVWGPGLKFVGGGSNNKEATRGHGHGLIEATGNSGSIDVHVH
ncbi:MAG: hypothetical protein M1833_000645 [Piccolia ochrophora]|nr:MAG: hypothetical protein M1833_000645 [Piccolia ochrophora]